MSMKAGERKRGFNTIPLTQGKVTKVDKDDYEFLNQFTWHYGGEKNPYAVRNIKTENGRRLKYMHRVIFQVDEGYDVDHLDTDGLNNQRSNLRKCTRGQNQMNRNKQTARVTTSKYKGVYFRKDTNKWNSEIRFNNKKYNLGSYSTQEEAALIYNIKAKELHGEFARLNDIEEVIV